MEEALNTWPRRAAQKDGRPVSPKGQAKIGIERLHVVEQTGGGKLLTVDEHAVRLCVIDLFATYLGIKNFVPKGGHAAFAQFFEYAARRMDAAIPQHQRRDHGGTLFVDTLQQAHQPVVMHDRVVFSNTTNRSSVWRRAISRASPCPR